METTEGLVNAKVVWADSMPAVVVLVVPMLDVGGRDSVGFDDAAEKVGRPRLAMKLGGTEVERDGICPV